MLNELLGRKPVEYPMKAWILKKWDWWVYRRAFHSFRRLCESNQGFAYLFEVHLRDYRAEHPIPERVERATETFYSAVRSLRPNSGTQPPASAGRLE